MSHNTLVPASTSKMDILPTTSPPNVRWASEKRAGDTSQSLTLKHKIICLLCSTKDEAVHNFGCPVVSKVPFFWRFFLRLSAFSAPFWMTSYVVSTPYYSKPIRSLVWYHVLYWISDFLQFTYPEPSLKFAYARSFVLLLKRMQVLLVHSAIPSLIACIAFLLLA